MFGKHPTLHFTISTPLTATSWSGGIRLTDYIIDHTELVGHGVRLEGVGTDAFQVHFTQFFVLGLFDDVGDFLKVASSRKRCTIKG